MTTYSNGPNPAQAYLQRQIEQATPVQTMLMLLDGILKFTLQAKESILRNDVEARCRANQRAMEITSYLLNQPDPSSGEAAARLSSILLKILQHQVGIDMRNAPEACDEVAALVRQLRAGFASLQTPKVVAGPEAATPPATLAASA